METPRGGPMKTRGYTIYFEDGEKHHYDNVVTMESGWISCFIDNPAGHNQNVKSPPRRVKKVEMEERE